ncbi:hypothetical protein, partial [Ruegeria hyattellae]|uniref:hypothetical protein n=1 Tax=Ruegeria hyattellae TaxID=3233337 RepID=UPI00355B5C27
FRAVRDPVLSLGKLVATGIIEFVWHPQQLTGGKATELILKRDPCNTVPAGVFLFQWNIERSVPLGLNRFAHTATLKNSAS